MRPPITRRLALGCLACAGAALAWRQGDAWLTDRRMTRHFADSLAAPSDPQSVYHLGHSLVGRDMPAMLAQLAGPGHRYDSQLGWGTSLRDHWEPDVPINGFAQENDHPRYRDAKEALESGDYDAVVLTEMVEIRDAIRYHDSAEYLARWADLARQGNRQARVYLYETWHHTDDGNGWLARIDRDLRKYWQRQVKYPAVEATRQPIHLIPAGQAMAAFVRAVEDAGGVEGVSSLHDLFTRRADGTPDTIHFNDLGAYLVALTHCAVIYHRNPVGAPRALDRADGTPATPPSPRAAELMQQAVRDTVARLRETGVAA
jgi:hypothetical protein